MDVVNEIVHAMGAGKPLCGYSREPGEKCLATVLNEDVTCTMCKETLDGYRRNRSANAE